MQKRRRVLAGCPLVRAEPQRRLRTSDSDPSREQPVDAVAVDVTFGDVDKPFTFLLVFVWANGMVMLLRGSAG